MDLARQAFYQSVTFQWIMGIAVSVLLTIFTAWAGYRAASPRQRLSYRVKAIVPLLNDSGTATGVQILLDGTELSAPHVLDVEVVNEGRRDIPTHAYDQDLPLRLDAGAPVLKILDVVSTPTEFRKPRHVRVDGTAITLGPDLLKRGQSVTFSLLVDGANPQVTIPEPPFIDVPVRPRTDAPTTNRAVLLTAGLGTGLLVSGGLQVLGSDWSAAVVGSTAVLGLITAVLGLSKSMRALSPRKFAHRQPRR